MSFSHFLFTLALTTTLAALGVYSKDITEVHFSILLVYRSLTLLASYILIRQPQQL